MTQPIEWQTATATVAQRVRQLRKERGWSAQALAEKCANAGMPGLDRAVLANLETGRRRNISIEELLVLALVLDVAPVHLLVPVDNSKGYEVGQWVMPASRAREWVRGNLALASQDPKRYELNKPDDEWTPPAPPAGWPREKFKNIVDAGDVTFIANTEDEES